MLALPLLFYPLSISSLDQDHSVDDVRVVQETRAFGLECVLSCMHFEGFLHPAIAIIGLNLSLVQYAGALLGVMLGSCIVIAGIDGFIRGYHKKLWASVQEYFTESGVQSGEKLKGLPIRTIDATFGEGASGCPVLQVTDEQKLISSLRVRGIHRPSLSLKYRSREYTPHVFVVDQVHRNISLFFFAVLIGASFYFGPPIEAALYGAYVVTLCLFQQEGVRVYKKSSCLYYLVDLALKVVALVAITLRPEVFLFSCKPVQYAVMAFVGWDILFSMLSFVLGDKGGPSLGAVTPGFTERVEKE